MGTKTTTTGITGTGTRINPERFPISLAWSRVATAPADWFGGLEKEVQ
jgi:hypothetical protein